MVGTRDASGNPVDVNVPMSIVDYNDAIENYTGDDEYGIPTAEGLANGKKHMSYRVMIIFKILEKWSHITYIQLKIIAKQF